MVVWSSNPLVITPNAELVRAGMAREDLFTVVHDQVLTDTARYADVVLPATTHFETHDLAASYGAYVLQETRPVIAPVGESRSNNELAAELARRLGYDLTRFDIDRAAILERSLRDDGTYDGARATRPARGTVQFRDTEPSHPDGRARLASMPGLGVPRYVELDDPHPLTLISPATPRTINSMFGEFQPADPVVRLHPDDAAARGLADGDAVVVRNDRASVPTTVGIDASLRPGLATMPKGSWCRDFASGLTVNALTPDTLSDLADGACFNDTRVEVERAG
jgi:anaerobic selenocysteine-containing dehydrogenase